MKVVVMIIIVRLESSCKMVESFGVVCGPPQTLPTTHKTRERSPKYTFPRMAIMILMMVIMIMLMMT